MSLVLADRVKVRTRTSGTGSFLIEDTFQGFQGFDAIGDGNETYYAVFDNVGNWEIGRGFYNSTAETLSRDTIIDSSNSGILVNFPVGGKTLFVTVPSALLDVVLSGTSDSFKFISVSGQPTVIADNATDSLILEAGSNISITTDAVTKKIIVSADVESAAFNLNVAAEDSTVRNIRLGETIKFIGGLNITTSSDEEGNITISGPDISGFATSASLAAVATSGSYNDLTDLPNLTNIGSLEIIGTVIDSNDSSEISFVPSVRFNSDVIIENELIVNAGIRGNLVGDISGNITGNISGDITGNLTGNVTGDLTGNVTGNVTGNIFTTLIDSADSTEISVVPALRLNSDLTVENEIFTSLLNAESSQLDVINTKDLSIGLDLYARSRTQLDDPELGTIKTLAMTAGFVVNRSTNPIDVDFSTGFRAPLDINYSGRVTTADATSVLRIVANTDFVPMRFAIQSAWGEQKCGLAFHAATSLDTLNFAVGRSAPSSLDTNAVILGFQEGPRLVVQKSYLGTDTEAFVGEGDAEVSDVITLNSPRTEVTGALVIRGTVPRLSVIEITSDDSSEIAVSSTMNFQRDVIVDQDFVAQDDSFLSRTYEKFHVIDSPSSSITLNSTNDQRGGIFYITNASSDFSLDFVDVDTSETKSISYAVIITQGATAYMPTTVSINGTPVALKWVGGGGAPLGNPNYVDIVNITVLSNSGTILQALASLSSFA